MRGCPHSRDTCGPIRVHIFKCAALYTLIYTCTFVRNFVWWEISDVRSFFLYGWSPSVLRSIFWDLAAGRAMGGRVYFCRFCEQRYQNLIAMLSCATCRGGCTVSPSCWLSRACLRATNKVRVIQSGSPQLPTRSRPAAASLFWPRCVAPASTSLSQSVM